VSDSSSSLTYPVERRRELVLVLSDPVRIPLRQDRAGLACSGKSALADRISSSVSREASPAIRNDCVCVLPSVAFADALSLAVPGRREAR